MSDAGDGLAEIKRVFMDLKNDIHRSIQAEVNIDF
jgi:hypothetical protein